MKVNDNECVFVCVCVCQCACERLTVNECMRTSFVECIACDCAHAPRLLMSQSVSISSQAAAGRRWRDGGGTLLPLSGCWARGSLTPLQQSSASIQVQTLVFTALLLYFNLTRSEANFWRPPKKLLLASFCTLKEVQRLYLHQMYHENKKDDPFIVTFSIFIFFLVFRENCHCCYCCIK